MKKLLLLVFAVTMVGSLAFGQTQVLSRNAVGYVRIDVKSNNLALCSDNFVGFSNTISGIFGNQLMGYSNIGTSDEIMVWSGTKYDRYWKPAPLGGSTWVKYPSVTAATNTLSPGQTFWIINKQPSNQTVYLMGQVPDSQNFGSTSTVWCVEGLNMPAYSFPVDVAITQLNLASAKQGNNIGAGDNLWKWDASIRNYVKYWKSPVGWVKYPATTQTVDRIYPGEGFWYVRRTNTVMTWAETKPYSWPL